MDLAERISELDLRNVYLDASVKLEPLVDRWHAWPHTLNPVTHAMNLEFRYLPTMRSFIAAPSVHVAACRDPSVYGGPFVDLPADSVEAATRYVEKTERDRAQALTFARELRKFDTSLLSATGFSLEEFREGAPAALKGLTEVVYDLNNHPKLRVLEEMIEHSDLVQDAGQEILLHRQNDIDRPFFLSTPRLQIDEGLFVAAPFRGEGARRLGSAHHRPVDLHELALLLATSVEALAPYFVGEAASPTAKRYAGEGVRIRYFGHACLLIETADVAILVDPTAARDPLPDARHFTTRDLPESIDYLFLSHGHQDHLCPEILLRLRDRVGCVLIPPNNRGELSDPSLKRILGRLGFTSIRTLEPLESAAIPGGAITALPFTGEHCDLDIHSKQCGLVELKGRRIGLFVDTDAIDMDIYRRLETRLQKLDAMFIGMECFGAPLSWLYGPLTTAAVSKRNDNSRRLSGANCERARRLTELLRPAQVYIYAMGQERWMRSLMGLQYTEDSVQLRESGEFAALCRQAGIPAERLYEHMETVL